MTEVHITEIKFHPIGSRLKKKGIVVRSRANRPVSPGGRMKPVGGNIAESLLPKNFGDFGTGDDLK
jgi:hypothetical protein